jgi:uncharacterized protein (DUF488 family)
VRRNQMSRKTGFSKGQLSSYCAKVGIDYRHLLELGIPSHRRQELNTMADYQALFADYRKEDLPQAAAAIKELGTPAQSRKFPDNMHKPSEVYCAGSKL